ncbi:hypothetical protein KILIM_109_00015, partial [Kineosphaera limosa NBRC 100340]
GGFEAAGPPEASRRWRRRGAGSSVPGCGPEVSRTWSRSVESELEPASGRGCLRGFMRHIVARARPSPGVIHRASECRWRLADFAVDKHVDENGPSAPPSAPPDPGGAGRPSRVLRPKDSVRFYAVS